MSQRAKGTFNVKMDPEPPFDADEAATLARVKLSKEFAGDLTATSRAEMLGARSAAVKGSAGYVAIERVKGTLGGRRGSFVLQHSGTMNRGQSSLTISVVPDCATDQLVGLTGQMTIDIVDGAHFYTFDYDLPPQG
jgi:hypothetical protein